MEGALLSSATPKGVTLARCRSRAGFITEVDCRVGECDGGGVSVVVSVEGGKRRMCTQLRGKRSDGRAVCGVGVGRG